MTLMLVFGILDDINAGICGLDDINAGIW